MLIICYKIILYSCFNQSSQNYYSALIENQLQMKVSRRPNSALSRQEALDISTVILSRTKKASQQQQKQAPAQIKTFPHSTPAKHYRINQQGVYNYVKNSICETFKQKTTRDYELVKELANITVPEQNQVIDRLCKKYSILRINKRSSFENAEVNVEQITKRYVRAKSKEKQKQEERARLKEDVKKNYRYGRNSQYVKSEQFFSFDGVDLKNLEKKHLQKNRYKQFQKKYDKSYVQEKKIHPYIELYEQAQRETLSSVIQYKKIELNTDYPAMFQPDEWQRNKDKIEKMIEGSKPQRKRQIQSARARITSAKTPRPDFYLT